MQKRAAIYVRVSTDKQTIDNQVAALRQIAERRGWEVVEQYHDAGISGAKRRDRRPGLDQILNDASRRKFDVMRGRLTGLGGHLLTCCTPSKPCTLAASIYISISRGSTLRHRSASSCIRSAARLVSLSGA